MNFWLGLVVGFFGAFTISFGAIIGWWFLLTRGNAQRIARATEEIRRVRDVIQRGGT